MSGFNSTFSVKRWRLKVAEDITQQPCQLYGSSLGMSSPSHSPGRYHDAGRGSQRQIRGLLLNCHRLQQSHRCLDVVMASFDAFRSYASDAMTTYEPLGMTHITRLQRSDNVEFER